jgi:hypothetical protein
MGPAGVEALASWPNYRSTLSAQLHTINCHISPHNMAEDDRPSSPSSAILQSPETPESPVIAVTKAPTEAGNDDDGGTSVAEPAPAPTTPNTAADLANKAIEFLSTAPPEQLIAISIGGAVVLYAILGKLGLLVVGVVAGAVGHASLNVPHARKEGSAFSADLHNWIEARKQARGYEDAALTKVRPVQVLSAWGF